MPSPALYAPERTVVTTALSKNLAAGGWRIGVARLPDGPFGAALRASLLGVASEIWSSAPAPMQHAAAYAFAEPPELVEHVDRSRRLHAAITGAVADRFAAAGARVTRPEAAFYLYPDLGPMREALEANHGVRTAADLTHLLLERYGVGVLPGSSFGDAPSALRMRVAPSLLYGRTTSSASRPSRRPPRRPCRGSPTRSTGSARCSPTCRPPSPWVSPRSPRAVPAAGRPPLRDGPRTPARVRLRARMVTAPAPAGNGRREDRRPPRPGRISVV